MKKFIFLDFDGVMNTGHYTNWIYHKGLPENDRFGSIFDPECVRNLRMIIGQTEAEIVVSSSWKDIMDYSTILQMWKERNLPGFVTDTTPTCSNHRGDEISRWLEIFSACSGGEEYEYVILDDLDDSSFNEDQVSHLVQVDGFDGLNKAKAQVAISILNGDDDYITPVANSGSAT